MSAPGHHSVPGGAGGPGGPFGRGTAGFAPPAQAGPPGPGDGPHGSFQARLRRTSQRVPLRAKLIVGMLVLVALGLTVMGAAGSTALRGYMMQQADEQLQSTGKKVQAGLTLRHDFPRNLPDVMYLQVWSDGTDGLPTINYQGYGVDPRSLPPVGRPEAMRRQDEIFTAHGTGRDAVWRVMTFTTRGGDVVVVGRNLKDVRDTVRQLVTIDITVGVLVLGGLGALAALVVT
ncbi:hypothetical protein AB0J52_15820, partial [Spirillospora sp. NPDC049652]